MSLLGFFAAEYRRLYEYCPNGPGGGVDPSCSPTGKAGGRPLAAIRLNDGTVFKTEIAMTEHDTLLPKIWEHLFGNEPKRNNPKWLKFKQSFYAGEEYGQRGRITKSGRFISEREIEQMNKEAAKK
jgi:hypothetical protein